MSWSTLSSRTNLETNSLCLHPDILTFLSCNKCGWLSLPSHSVFVCMYVRWFSGDCVNLAFRKEAQQILFFLNNMNLLSKIKDNLASSHPNLWSEIKDTILFKIWAVINSHKTLLSKTLAGIFTDIKIGSKFYSLYFAMFYKP